MRLFADNPTYWRPFIKKWLTKAGFKPNPPHLDVTIIEEPDDIPQANISFNYDTARYEVELYASRRMPQETAFVFTHELYHIKTAMRGTERESDIRANRFAFALHPTSKEYLRELAKKEER